MPKFDLLCIGDSAVDIFTSTSSSDVHCQLHGGKDDCELCLFYGAKVPADSFTISFGGNAANVAVGASRLGINTSVYTHVGGDLFGKEILDNFRSQGVSVSHVVVDKDKPSNVSLVLSHKGERTILSRHESRDYRVPEISTPFVYFSSLAQGHREFHEPFLKYLKENGSKLIFNPGSRQIEEGVGVLKPFLEISRVLLVNLEEAQKLTQNKTNNKNTLLKQLSKLGPKIVVITDGPRGAWAYGGKLKAQNSNVKTYFQEIYPMKAVERTGAGDAFSSGFMSALIYGKDVKQALRWGSVNAAFATQQVGAQKGLLRREELLEKLKSWNSRQGKGS